MRYFTRLRSSLLALALTGLPSCGHPAEEVEVKSYSRDGAIDEGLIVQDIRQALGPLVQGIVENNAALIFSIFSETKETTYVRKGHFYSDVKEAEKSYAKALAKETGKRAFRFTEQRYDVLDERAVLFTALGEITYPDKADAKPWNIAYTIVWTLEPGGWKALSMHISW